MSVTVKLNFGGVDPFLKAVVDGCNYALDQTTQAALTYIDRAWTRNGMYNPSAPGQPPNINTGNLRNNTVASKAKNMRCAVGTPVKYGLYLENGATITPKNVKFLPVPIGPEGSRFRASHLGSLKGTGLTLIPRKGKPALLVREVGKGSKRTGARIEPLFVLLPSVRIQPRPWLGPAIRNNFDSLNTIFNRQAWKHIKANAKTPGRAA